MIPIIHSRIHARLVEKTRGNIIGYGFVVECISRMINFKGGLPKCDIHTTVEDLVKLGLLQKVNRLKFKLSEKNNKNIKIEETFICPNCKNEWIDNRYKLKFQLLKNKDKRLRPQIF